MLLVRRRRFGLGVALVVFLWMQCVTALASPVRLSCRTNEDGARSLALELDEQAGTVDGNQASFSDTMIVWPSTDSGVLKHNELNRVSGRYKAWPENEVMSVPPPVYLCDKETPPPQS